MPSHDWRVSSSSKPVEMRKPACKVRAMTRWPALTALCLLALWLPALNHCRLEQLPSFAFLVCCPHEDATPHQDDDCETDGCALVEDNFFKLEESPVAPAAPDLLSTPAAFANAFQPPPLVLPAHDDPQILRDPWPLVMRAAGLPRAPSLPA